MSKSRPSQKIKNKGKRGRSDSQQKKVLSLPGPFLRLLPVLLLIGTTLAIFWPLGNHEFINLDDDVYVYHNPQVKAGLTLKGVIWAFTSLKTSNWHPLTWLSHMLDCQLYGLNPGAHHVTSLLFHIANTVLLFWVLKRMTGRIWASSFVAALFALHPLHVESVAWVAERKDVLSTFFWMLTLWGYLRYTERPGLNRYLLAILFFALGLLFKPMLVTVPFVLLLLDYWPLGRFSFRRGAVDSPNPKSSRVRGQGPVPLRLVLEKVPFFVLSAISSLLTFFVQRSGGAVGSLQRLPMETRLANAIVSYAHYIQKMVWPRNLAVLYPYPDMIAMGQVGLAGILLLGISVFVFRWARTRPYLLVGWLWYLGTLVPVIGLVQVGTQAMADRYTYVPLIGLFIMIAWGIPDILAGWRYRKATLTVSAVLLLSIFMVVTNLQIQKWHDNIRLFTHTLKVTNRNALIHYNLGIALSVQRKDGEAMAHYKEALWIDPNYVEAYNNLGVTLADQGKTQEAISYYSQALRINPKYVEAHNNLGNVLAKQGKIEEAAVHYTEALRTKPDFAEAHYNLGTLLARQGKIEEAGAHFTQALRIKPDYAEAYNNLGNVLAQQGKIEEAATYYTQALRIRPDLAEAHFSLGMAYLTIGNRGSALEEYEILKRINPGMANDFAKKIFK
jgi:tetratricopeptide (TPR) repeat protein